MRNKRTILFAFIWLMTGTTYAMTVPTLLPTYRPFLAPNLDAGIPGGIQMTPVKTGKYTPFFESRMQSLMSHYKVSQALSRSS